MTALGWSLELLSIGPVGTYLKKSAIPVLFSSKNLPLVININSDIGSF